MAARICWNTLVKEDLDEVPGCPNKCLGMTDSVKPTILKSSKGSGRSSNKIPICRRMDIGALLRGIGVNHLIAHKALSTKPNVLSQRNTDPWSIGLATMVSGY